MRKGQRYPAEGLSPSALTERSSRCNTRVTTKTGGRKKCRIKAGGRFGAPPAVNTAPQSGSGLFHRWSEFQLLAVAGGRKQEIQSGKRLISGFPEVAVSGGFGAFLRGSLRGSVFTLWGHVGGLLQLNPYSRHILDGSKRGYVRGFAPTRSKHLRGQKC